MGGSLPIMMFCVGATPWAAASMGLSSMARSTGRVKITPYAGFRRVVALMLVATALGFGKVEAVVCDTCKDTIGGCAGGANCPLLKAPSENAAALAASV